MSRDPAFYLDDVLSAGAAIASYVRDYDREQFLNDPNYFKVEEEIIWETLARDLPDLMAACSRLAKDLTEHA